MAIRDEPGPAHAPHFTASEKISGVVTMVPPTVIYAEGVLTELYRPEWLGLFGSDEPITHLYSVWAPEGAGLHPSLPEEP